MFTIKGLSKLEAAFSKTIVNAKTDIATKRKLIATALTTEIEKNVPVWSGRSLSSLKWSNGVTASAMIPHPDRGDTSTDGFFKFHADFGRTSSMSLGQEPMRGTALANSLASLANVSYDIDQRLFLEMNSTAGDKINAGEAPSSNKTRNKGVVEALAVAQIKVTFSGLVK
jgi:hypothetical protein